MAEQLHLASGTSFGGQGASASLDFWKENISMRKVVRNRNFQTVSPLIFAKKHFFEKNSYKSKFSGSYPHEPEIYDE